jgi:hypothetical protein
MKKSNNIISDWLDKYGNPEIDKKVEMELEKITKEIYNKFIDDAYKNYGDSHTTFLNGFTMVKPMVHSKETFINECKSNEKFAKKWGVKITERELSFEERKKYGIDILGYESLLDYGHSQNDDDIILELLNEWNIPTKIITLQYKEEKVSYYE